jgi:hypothetical protein
MQSLTIRWIDALDISRDALLHEGARREARLTQAAGARMITAWALAPAPRDPVRHLQVAHARARAHLAGLGRHDPAREVPSVMTEELFARLTAPTPARGAGSRAGCCPHPGRQLRALGRGGAAALRGAMSVG